MKKVCCANRARVVLAVVVSMFFAPVFAFVLNLDVIVESCGITVTCVVGAFILFFVTYWLVLLNDICRFLHYDSNNKVLTFKGLFWGCKGKIKIEELQAVTIEIIHGYGVFFVFEGAFEAKKSFKAPDRVFHADIFIIPKTDKNEKFIGQFWDKPIEDNTTKRIFR